MTVEEVRSRHRKINSEEDSEGLLLEAMHELDECSNDVSKREQAEKKVQVLGEAHQRIVDGRRHDHELKLKIASGLGAIAGGAFLVILQDSRIVPRTIEEVMKSIRRS